MYRTSGTSLRPPLSRSVRSERIPAHPAERVYTPLDGCVRNETCLSPEGSCLAVRCRDRQDLDTGQKLTRKEAILTPIYIVALLYMRFISDI
jgi:hypothetical protein